VKITYKDGKYIDRAGGVTYLAAGVCYEPVSVGDEYAVYGKTVLYEINGLDPKEWMTEKYDGIGSIYYSEEINLPAFEEFEPNKIYACEVDYIIVRIAEVTDLIDVNAVTDLYLNGEQTELPIDGTHSYHLKFSSEKYPGIYYNLLYVIADGGNYLYDRDTKRCVEIGGVLEKYIWIAGENFQ